MKMRNKLVVSGLAALLGLAVAAKGWAQCVATDDATGIKSFTLFAGQTIDAGTVSAEVVGSDLVVTYKTTSGWELVEAHLWVGSKSADMPQTRKGNPIPGQFPHVSGDITGATSYEFSIPLADLGFSCPGDDMNFLVAAHAALRRANGDGTYQTETGWSDGARITERGNWATLSTITLTCDCGGTGSTGGGNCETAFARAATPVNTCFLDLDEDGDGTRDFSRWGWTNGPLSYGTYTYDIYAGAGQCDINKGTLVGTLTTVYDGPTATVTYDIAAPYNLKESHLYVGSDVLPINGNGFNTVAPGQYPQLHEGLDGASSDDYVFDGLSGEVYIVAHATVCGFPD